MAGDWLLDKITELEAKATPGPWYEVEYGDVDGEPSQTYIHGVQIPGTGAFSYEDAEFIAYCRQWVRDAILEIRGLREAKYFLYNKLRAIKEVFNCDDDESKLPK